MCSGEARLVNCRGLRGSGALPVTSEAAAEPCEAADGEVEPLGAAQRAQVTVHEEGVVQRQEVVDTARGEQATKVAQAGLQAEGDEQGTLIRCIHAERVGGRRLRVSEKKAVKDRQEAASLASTALHKILYEGVVAQRCAQHWVPAPSRDAIAPEHGVAACLEGQGWIA